MTAPLLPSTPHETVATTPNVAGDRQSEGAVISAWRGAMFRQARGITRSSSGTRATQCDRSTGGEAR